MHNVSAKVPRAMNSLWPRYVPRLTNKDHRNRVQRFANEIKPIDEIGDIELETTPNAIGVHQSVAKTVIT